MPATTIALIVLGGLGFTIAVLWLVKRWFLSMLAAARAKLDGFAAGRVAKRLDDRANFFGVDSKSAAQLRGNGVLALYDTEVIFVQLMIDRVIRIPVTEITEITTTKVWKGKTIFRDLLKVTWREGASTETAVWFVVDLPGWLDALRRAQPSATAEQPRV
jgi:hypothetical protein